MHGLSLDLLRTFVVFVDSRNLVEAARKLGITQPAVSLQLKRLEGSLPYPLFSTEGNRKVASPYGRALYHALRERVEQLGESISRVNDQFGDPSCWELRIGARKELFLRAMRLLPFPGCLHFVDLPASDATQALLRHEIDLAISWEKPNSSNIIAKPLFSNATRLCVAPKLLGGRKLTEALATRLDFLTGTPCIVYKPEPPFVGEWLRHCGGDAKDLRIKCVCPDWGAIAQMVEEGVGYSVIPTDFEVAPHVATFDIPAEIIPEISYFALYHRDLRGLPALRALLGERPTRT